MFRDPSQNVRIVLNPPEPILKIYVISPAAWTVSEDLGLDNRLPKSRGYRVHDPSMAFED
jgi:hypothetical protein